MRFFFIFFVLLPFAASNAQVLPAPALSARAWVLMDHASGQVLAAQEPDLKLEPASLTKVMTTYLVAEALQQKRLSLQQTVTVSERAWRTQGSRSFVPVNKGVEVDALFKGMVIQSGNDASVALAEAVAGSEEQFAAMMNRTAQRLGLKDTNFLNSSGYFEGPAPTHHSTARDLAKLAAALIRDHPETHALHAMKEYTYAGIRQHNRNRLLWADPTVDGLKTGHSSAAGYCLIATAKRGPRRLISVVLGTASEDARARDSLNLLNWAIRPSMRSSSTTRGRSFPSSGFSRARRTPSVPASTKISSSRCRAAWRTRSPPNWSAASRCWRPSPPAARSAR